MKVIGKHLKEGDKVILRHITMRSLDLNFTVAKKGRVFKRLALLNSLGFYMDIDRKCKYEVEEK